MVHEWLRFTRKTIEISGATEIVDPKARTQKLRKAVQAWAITFEKWGFVRRVFESLTRKVTAVDALKFWRSTIAADELRVQTLRTRALLAWQRESLASKVDRFLQAVAERHTDLRILRKALVGFRKNAVISRMKPVIAAKSREALLLEGVLGLIANSVDSKIRRTRPRLACLFRKWRRLTSNLSIH